MLLFESSYHIQVALAILLHCYGLGGGGGDTAYSGV